MDAASAGDDGPGGGGKTEEDGEEERQGRLPFGTAYHVPVVCKEVSENSNERKTISKLPHNPSNRQPGEPRSCSVRSRMCLSHTPTGGRSPEGEAAKEKIHGKVLFFPHEAHLLHDICPVDCGTIFFF